jgi:hypothetical protein
MSKIKTLESAYSAGYDWTQWHTKKLECRNTCVHHYGICRTKAGYIILRINYVGGKCTWAHADIIHDRVEYVLQTDDKICKAAKKLTKLGWTRIAKKWARKIRQS